MSQKSWYFVYITNCDPKHSSAVSRLHLDLQSVTSLLLLLARYWSSWPRLARYWWMPGIHLAGYWWCLEDRLHAIGKPPAPLTCYLLRFNCQYIFHAVICQLVVMYCLFPVVDLLVTIHNNIINTYPLN